jgi:hypothetical protein
MYTYKDFMTTFFTIHLLTGKTADSLGNQALLKNELRCSYNRTPFESFKKF